MTMEAGARKPAPLAIDVCEFRPEDYEAYAELCNVLYPDQRETAEEIRYDEEHLDREKYRLKRYLALDPGIRKIVAAVEYEHPQWTFHPDKYWVWVGVRPENQRRGIGSNLYDRIERELQDLGAIALRASVRENARDALAFATKRGFRERLRNWQSNLSVGTFDFSRFAGEDQPPPGIAFVTLAEERARDPDCLRNAFDLSNAIMRDVPLPDVFTPPTFERFQAGIDGPGALPETYFLAKDGDAYVGMSNLWSSQAMEGIAFHGLTGVLRSHRRRGIALALKLRTVAWAKEHGYTSIRTWNNTGNRGILAINDRLGFVREPAWIEMEKDLAAEVSR